MFLVYILLNYPLDLKIFLSESHWFFYFYFYFSIARNALPKVTWHEITVVSFAFVPIRSYKSLPWGKYIVLRLA